MNLRDGMHINVDSPQKVNISGNVYSLNLTHRTSLKTSYPQKANIFSKIKHYFTYVHIVSTLTERKRNCILRRLCQWTGDNFIYRRIVMILSVHVVWSCLEQRETWTKKNIPYTIKQTRLVAARCSQLSALPVLILWQIFSKIVLQWPCSNPGHISLLSLL